MASSNDRPSRLPAGLQSFRPVIDRLVFVLALIGVLLAVHLWIQQGRGFDRGCFGFSAPDPAATVGCEVVTASAASTFMGLPNALLGGLFYLGVAVLSIVAMASLRFRGIAKSARSLLVLVGAVYSGFLIYYQYAVLEEWCVLCTISAGLVAVLLVIHLIDVLRPPQPASTHQTDKPMKREFSFYAVAALLVFVLAGADLWYFNSLDEAGPEQAPAQALNESREPAARQAPGAAQACSYDAEKGRIDNWQDFVNFSDPMKGDPQADVTVIEFFDPNCPHCKTLHPVMERVAEENGDVAQFVYKSFPLWDYSVPQVLALHVAAQEGKFFEMKEAQFERQQRGGLGVDQLREIAGELRMDADDMVQRMRQESLVRSVINERQRAAEAGVNSMPTVLINGRFVDGPRTEACLTQLIEEAAAS